MSIKLYDRYDLGDSMLSKDGEVILRAAQYIIKDFLFRMEADNESPIDLRDFQSVVHSAVDGIILEEIVSRRLEATTEVERSEMVSSEEIANYEYLDPDAAGWHEWYTTKKLV